MVVRFAKRALLSALFVCTALVRAETADVQHAIDGDSLLLANGRQVRLIGINAPELGIDGRPDQPLARAAKTRATQLTKQRPVTLTPDHEPTDRHGRLLAYASLADGTDIQLVLLREGLAWCVAIPPNVARAEEYCAAEREARGARRGVWAEPAYQPTPADRLGSAHTGFRHVVGVVRRVGRSKHTIYLDLHPRFSVTIPLEAWAQFPASDKPAPGQRIVARGWVTEYKNSFRMRIAHPAMLEVVP